MHMQLLVHICLFVCLFFGCCSACDVMCVVLGCVMCVSTPSKLDALNFPLAYLLRVNFLHHFSCSPLHRPKQTQCIQWTLLYIFVNVYVWNGFIVCIYIIFYLLLLSPKYSSLCYLLFFLLSSTFICFTMHCRKLYLQKHLPCVPRPSYIIY